MASKYNLSNYVNEFLQNTVFPNKKAWKTLVESAVREQEDQRVNLVLKDYSLTRFRNVYGCNLNFHSVWLAENSTNGHRKHLRDLAKLNCVLSIYDTETICVYCNKSYQDQLIHFR